MINTGNLTILESIQKVKQIQHNFTVSFLENQVHTNMEPFKKLIRSYSRVIFPVTCACCGASQEKEGEYLCSWCKIKRFERANSDDLHIVPEKIDFVYSLWNFDKGGYLQDLLHNLKYNFMMGVGEELGRFTAQSFIKDYHDFEELDQQKPIVVPVPLHKSKKRTRGYNQARALARGFSSVTGWDISGSKTVNRVKKTRTQTGLSTSERSKNVMKAFEIDKPEQINNRFSIIIDDVFTTGATTYELADCLIKHGSKKCGIITVAKA